MAFLNKFDDPPPDTATSITPATSDPSDPFSTPSPYPADPPQTVAAGSIFAQYPAARWTVGSSSWTFPIVSVQEEYSNALARHKRLYRDKERLDDTGSMSRVFTFQSEFYNGAIDKKAPGRYPDDINSLLAMFKIHETGTLTVPTRGPIQARAWTYKRLEQSTDRDFAGLVMVFLEDAPDDEQASQWQAPTASSVASIYVNDYVTKLQKLGIDGDPLGDLLQFANDLEGLANAPSNFASAIEARGQAAVQAFTRAEQAFASGPLGDLSLGAALLDPFASSAIRALRRAGDTLGSAVASHISPMVITKTFDVTASIYDVAIFVDQPAEDLIPLNQGLASLLAIPPQTPVRVYADAKGF